MIFHVLFIAFSFFSGWHTGGKSIFQADTITDSAGIAFIEQNTGRLLSIHMKEYGNDGKNAEFGCGILPWREIMQAAEAGGTSIGILEQEEYSCPPLESVAIGAKNIEKIFN